MSMFLTKVGNFIQYGRLIGEAKNGEKKIYKKLNGTTTAITKEGVIARILTKKQVAKNAWKYITHDFNKDEEDGSYNKAITTITKIGKLANGKVGHVSIDSSDTYDNISNPNYKIFKFIDVYKDYIHFVKQGCGINTIDKKIPRKK